MKSFSFKPIRFLALLILICCLHSAAWARAGFAEWEISTPGGNKIGNNDGLPAEVKGAAIYSGEIHPSYSRSSVYVDRVGKYGFYDGAIIGETDNKFFLFNESTKAITKFSTKAELCADVKAKKLKFNNSLKFLNGSHPYDYYILRYALYFLFPFVILLVGFSIAKQKVPFPQRINEILKSFSFLLLLYVLSNFIFYVCKIDTVSDGWDIFIFWYFALLIQLAFVGGIECLLWALSYLGLRVIDKVRVSYGISDSIFFAVLKCAIVAGIITTGLLLTISPFASSFTSARYFSCLELL